MRGVNLVLGPNRLHDWWVTKVEHGDVLGRFKFLSHFSVHTH